MILMTVVFSHVAAVLLSALIMTGTVSPSAQLVSAMAVSTATAEPPMPDTPAGRCAAAWFALLRTGTADDVREFEQTYRAPKRLAERSVDDRVTSFPRIQKEFDGLVVREIGESTDARLVVYAHAAPGPATIEFELDSAGKLDAIKIGTGGDSGMKGEPLTAARRAAIVEAAVKAMREEYVYPDKGGAMADVIAKAHASGGYDSIDDESALVERMTKDMRTVMNDKHLRVRIAPESQLAGRASPMGPTPDQARRENWGFKHCEIADGNIGVLRFDVFVPTDEAKRVADAAMAFLGRCDALVIDLRQNGGGSPDMICYLSGYLFDKPTLLNRMKDRNGSVVGEGFSAETVQGERFAADLPVYVVTSNRTFSGAEEFAYNLKNLDRATLVGETTGGGAHPVKPVRLDDRTIIMMPYMRAENPISQTNWEGTGVKPDVEVPAERALEKALELARTKLGRG